jgi:outer membrane murein-binding lipoprotein Lpp
LAVLAAVAVFAAVAYGCGSSDSSVSSGGRTAKVHAAPAAGGLQTVEYQGVAFDVPGDWPVYDLAADPTMCVRFDVHAVYLGDPSPDMNCPAGGVGSTEAVLVQPVQRDTTALAGQVSTMDVHGLRAEVSDQRASMGQLQADIGDVRASITTGGDSDALAQQILQSFRAAGQ